MRQLRFAWTVVVLGALAWRCGGSSAIAAAADEIRPMKICATVSDLGDLAREVGGEHVEVTVFAKGPQDPHFLEAKPSFIKALANADALVLVGLDLEAGWAPALWKSARNGRVLPGADGHIDASKGITALDLPAGIVDRALGDVHAQGNPHYLSDPINGLRVARLLRDRFQALQPTNAAHFGRRYDDLALRLGVALVGEALAQKYDVEKLSILADAGKLEEFLARQGDPPVQGWLGRLARARGARVACDHNLWPYLAKRFGFTVMGFLEPKPGIPPTTRHLGALIDRMKTDHVPAILTISYFDPRHARLVSERTGARVVVLAHQCGALPGTDRYIDCVEHNVKQLETAFGGKP